MRLARLAARGLGFFDPAVLSERGRLTLPGPVGFLQQAFQLDDPSITNRDRRA